ncbi:Uma2 family endonuclease [Kitasatospora atroaurantiaca]|uniref:Uma2 family endonuclease n=2 Tax=Kitasatospora atroaurantiaca TaxID=285545 RepID=A0A561EQH5_9ACTN|nr:Uma2 family endonuclease [Kitasatospora atroaurantiaca]
MAAMPSIEQPNAGLSRSAEDELLDAFLNLSTPAGFRAELIEGEIVVTPPPDGNHEAAFAIISKQLYRMSRDEVHVSGAKGLITPRGRFIPDGTVGHEGLFDDQEPWMPAAGVLLVFEITSSRPSTDREAKRLGYAAAGIPLYLLVDRTDGALTLFSSPENGDYRDLNRVSFGKPLELPAPFAFTLDSALLG